jgi:hypothetical protein
VASYCCFFFFFVFWDSHNLVVAGHACNPSIWEGKARGLWVRGQFETGSYVDQGSLELTNFLPWHVQVPGLQVCSTKPSYTVFLIYILV